MRLLFHDRSVEGRAESSQTGVRAEDISAPSFRSGLA